MNARIGMLAPPRGDDAAEHEALISWIGGSGMCSPEPWPAGGRVVAVPTQMFRQLWGERGRMHYIFDH